MSFPPPDPRPEDDPPAAPAEHAELQRQGAKAAARGEAADANPMLEAINQPAATGETDQVWSGRRDAWRHGHEAQQGLAASPGRAPGLAAAHERDAAEALFGVTRVLTFAGPRRLTSASGFFFEREHELVLVTCRHVLADAATGHAPDRLEIVMHTDARDLTRVATLSILLHEDGRGVWRQARDSGGDVDVGVVPLDRAALPPDAVLRPFGPRHLPAGFDLFEVGDALAIPGFPLGFHDSVHHLPVVRLAGIASSHGVRFQGLGCFLTDARTHRGSSGAPVLARMEGGRPDVPRWCLLGVHASRLDMAPRDLAQDESLGLNSAWYADVLMTLTAPQDTDRP